MNQSSVTRIIAAVIGGILRNFFAGAVIVVVAAHLLHALYVYLLDLQFWPQGWVERSIATLWLLLWTSFVAIAGAAVHFSCTAYSGLRANRLGICSGLRTAGSGHRIPALTDWLHQLIQDIAGAPLDKPLTFGDLEQSCPPISLAFMTTGISEMRAQRLPHTGASLLFRVSEISHLFPQEVVAWMRTHARKADADSRAMLKRYDPHAETDRQDLYFLPCTNDLPIVFCARMSLSFPVLLQAVPLLRKRFIHGDGLREGALELARVWFSDGGLTSNFPIHFLTPCCLCALRSGLLYQTRWPRARMTRSASPYRTTICTVLPPASRRSMPLMACPRRSTLPVLYLIPYGAGATRA